MEQIKALIAKGAIVGGALDAWMTVPGWKRGVSLSKKWIVHLEVIINHIDYICQIAGNTWHIGIGADLDGAFGKEQCPFDLETIANLQNLPASFTNVDIQKKMLRLSCMKIVDDL